jgi:spore cortex biosynthesis protein YabQ
MNDAIMIELHFFGTSILWGALILVFYDVLRIIRRIIIHNGFFVALEDLLYWVICSLLIFHMMYKQNNGIIRGFAILAMLLGMIIYRGTLSDLLVETISNVLNTIINFVKKTIGKVISIFLKPIKFIFKKLHKFFRWIFSKIKKFLRYILKPLKKIRKSSKIKLPESEENEKGD